MTKLIEQINNIREQLDELERMMMNNVVKLPWDQAPEWAQWAAMDGTGEWWWYEYEPIFLTPADWEEWCVPGGTCLEFEFPHCTNWKESKRQRP